MGRVSRRKINKDLERDLEEQLSFIIISLTAKEDVGVFLDEFFTKEEKTMLGKRLILYMLLYKGLSNVQINAALSVSHETTRLYREFFEKKPEVFRRLLERLIKREKTQEFWKKIEKVLEPFKLALESKSNMKSRWKLASGDFWKE